MRAETGIEKLATLSNLIDGVAAVLTLPRKTLYKVDAKGTIHSAHAGRRLRFDPKVLAGLRETTTSN